MPPSYQAKFQMYCDSEILQSYSPNRDHNSYKGTFFITEELTF